MTYIDYPLRFLMQEQIWITTGTPVASDVNAMNSPFYRMRRLWHSLSFAARGELGTTQMSISPDGQIFHVSRGLSPPLDVSLFKWAKAAKKSIEVFQESVQKLVPDDMLVNEFAFENIRDDNSPRSVHEQKLNRTWLYPMQQNLQRELFHRRGQKNPIPLHSSNTTVSNWLSLDQQAQSALAACFALTCGICIRGWQFIQLCFGNAEDKDRNLWVLSNGLIIIANPISKQRHRACAPTLFAFPRTLSKFLAYYLFVIRPAVSDFLQGDGLDVSIYRSRIWAYAIVPPLRKKSPSLLWTGCDISKAIKFHTSNLLGVSITPIMLRQVAQGVFRDKLPGLFENCFRSTSTNVATGSSLLKNYERACRFPELPNIPPDRPVLLLSVSEIWHAMLDVGPLNKAWAPMVAGSHFFQARFSDELAFATARQAIKSDYRICGNQPDSCQHARRLLSTLPFIYGNVSTPFAYMQLLNDTKLCRAEAR